MAVPAPAPPRRRGRWRAVLAAVVVAASLLGAVHIAWAFLSPATTPARIEAQLAYLDRALDGGAAADMQQLFPEGEFFLHALDALAAAQHAREAPPGPGRDEALRRVARALTAIERPSVQARFGDPDLIPHGVFYQGWRLQLLVARADLSEDRGHRQAARIAAEQLLAAAEASPAGLLDSYRGRYWPCDNVVALAAVARTTRFIEVPDGLYRVARWRDALLKVAGDGLLPHETRVDGMPVVGPRGSSQAIVQAFWPDIDPATADGQWRRFHAAFVVGRLGLVGVSEYPDGRSGPGDVDSGPLLLGVSASASAVTLAAARRHGDTALADALDRQAELLGLPLQWDGRRFFAFGTIPIGDAFVAWARTAPWGETASAVTGQAVRVWWPVHLLLVAAPGALVGWRWWRRRTRG